MQKNKDLITQFYTAFQKGDFATMQNSYHDEAHFSDPAFQNLNAKEVRAMWQMLVTAAKDLRITFTDVQADELKGSGKWEAHYTFSKTGNKVVNNIKAFMRIRDGKIIEHSDAFRLSAWITQALGWKGVWFGWTGFMKRAVQKNARRNLLNFIEKKNASKS